MRHRNVPEATSSVARFWNPFMALREIGAAEVARTNSAIFRFMINPPVGGGVSGRELESEVEDFIRTTRASRFAKGVDSSRVERSLDSEEIGTQGFHARKAGTPLTPNDSTACLLVCMQSRNRRGNYSSAY